MSRKHYEAVATRLRQRLEEFGEESSTPDDFDAGHHHALVSIAQDLAELFEHDNARFDRERFLQAAGI